MAEKKVKGPRLVTPVFRVSFPSLFRFARQMDDDKGKPAFEVTGIFVPSKFTAKEKEAWQKMKAMADKASMEKFKKPLKSLPANFRNPFRDGMEKEHLDGYGAGTVFVKFKTWRKPGVVVPDGSGGTVDANEEDVYAGCYGRVSVGIYAYDNKSKGVAFSMNNFMFVKDGERLDGGSSPDEDFKDYGEASDDSGDEADDLAG